jgi:hypothetical protein
MLVGAADIAEINKQTLRNVRGGGDGVAKVGWGARVCFSRGVLARLH